MFINYFSLRQGQVELSARPTTLNQTSTFSSNYPCGICQKKTKDSHNALLCDKCELWFHTNSPKFPASNYSTLFHSLDFFGFAQNVDTPIINMAHQT